MNRKGFIEAFGLVRENHEVEAIHKYLTDDFLVTNLQNNTTFGQGLSYAIEASEREADRGLVFKTINTFSVGDFEVYTYEVTVESGEKFVITIVYRF